MPKQRAKTTSPPELRCSSNNSLTVGLALCIILTMKKWLIAFIIFDLFFGAGWAVYLKQPPEMKTFEHLQLNNTITSDSKLKVTFFGTSTLLFDDGETAWMTDAFFSRPGVFDVAFGKITPNEVLVSEALKQSGVKSLAAIIPIHSHYDHALDSALVAQKTGAKLMGSSSTANIGRGFPLPEDQIQIVNPGDAIQLGKFKITFIASYHSPGAFYEGNIEQPLSPQQPASHYQMGDCYSLLVEHVGHSYLIHGSAGFIPDALKNFKAEVVFLGIGVLGKQSIEFKENYWNEVVRAVGAKRIILIHWDNFFRSLNAPLMPFPWPIDDFKSSMEFLTTKSQNERVDLRLPKINQAFNP